VRVAEIRGEWARLLGEHQVRHLVHVGAHEGEEVPYYLAAGIGRVTLVEPIPHLAGRLRAAYPSVTVVEAACSDETGTAALHIPAKTNMATLLPTDGKTIEVPLRRLDDIAPDADAAVIDVQGHEFAVLSAAPWGTLRLLMVETCTVDDPILAPPYGEMVTYMAGRGFTEIARLTRDYDYIQRWAYGRTTRTGGEVRDVVFARTAEVVAR
jgi:FkbM family methyltransferase